MYLLLLSIIYLAFISLGLPDSLLGSSWPTIYTELNVPISYLGIVTMIVSSSTVLSSLFTDRAIAKLGTHKVTAISVLLTSVALFGFSTAKEFYQLCLWGLPYGLGAGAIDAALNNYVALHYNARHMSWLHCFWGVGATISPCIMSFALVHSVWYNGYRTVSLIQLVIAIAIILSAPLWKSHAAEHDEVKVEPIGITKAVKIKGVLPVVTGFLAYCATESTAMLWASSYFEGAFATTKDEAAALGSIFFIGMTSGRFAAGFVTERIGDRKMIRFGAALALCGIIMITLPIKWIAIIGFILLGLGCAPIYPCIIHSTPARFGQERSQSIIGIQMAFAYLGSTIMPPIFGLIANHIDIRLMPLYLAFFTIMMLIMMQKADKDAPI